MNKRSAIPIALSLFAASETHAQNGGTSCATAATIVSGNTISADTTAAPNWMTSFGPLVSPSNDVVYTYTLPASVPVQFMPVAADYAFAMYLIPSCNSGSEPVPLAATATIGVSIDYVGQPGQYFWP